MDSNQSLVFDAAEINFCLYDWLEVENLTQFDRYSEHSRETFDGLLDLSRQLAEELFAPHNRAADLAEPQLIDGKVRLIDEIKPALDAFAEAGLVAATFDEADEGFQLPHTVYRAAFMWLQAANISTVSYPMLTTAAAHVIREHASPELVATYLPPMLDGRWFGTMNLSEPGVGSALGDLKTTAIKQPDGSYRLRGEKMWISGGEHELSENIVHLVLARTGGPGVKGLSLLIVPRWLGSPGALEERNDIALVGLNHKMGYRGTVNTALSYGSGSFPVAGEAGAVGYLIGNEGEGLRYMFLMMNEARIGVGAGAAALGMTGWLHARQFARERMQGRSLAAKDVSLDAVPIVRHPDVRRMLLRAKSYSEGSVAVVLYAARLLDESQSARSAEERAAAALLLDVLTPIVKSWPSQWALAANDLAIQVHGGSGYVRDFPLEQFYRDNRLNPIHEGTHGIQALDLLGRKVRLEGGAGFSTLLERMRETIGRAGAAGTGASDLSATEADATPTSALNTATTPSTLSGADAGTAVETNDRTVNTQTVDLAALLATRVDRLEEVTGMLWSSGDPEAALGNAADYLEAAGDVVIAWLLLDQLLSLADRNDEFAESKRLTVRYFVTHVLPRADAQLDLLASGDSLLIGLDEALI